MKENKEVFNCYTVDIHTKELEIYSYFIVAKNKKKAIKKAISKFVDYNETDRIKEIRIKSKKLEIKKIKYIIKR